MKLKRDTTGFALALACVGMLMPGDAFAYIDPGTGSMILQLLLGGVAGALVVGKLYWHKLRAMFGHGSKISLEEAEEDKGGHKDGDT